MRTVLKSAAFNVALLAMLLRAVLPQGWMPNPQSATEHTAAIMLCPGMTMPAAPAQKPDHTKITFCACAAAAPLSTAMACVAALSPSPPAGSLAFAATHDATVLVASYRPNSARAPPLSV